jgi:hypothetical protein
MNLAEATTSTMRLRNQPVAFLSQPHRFISPELQPVAGGAAAELVERLQVINARLGPDCFCQFLRRKEVCGRYHCDLRDLSRRFLDHAVALTSASGERFVMGSNHTDNPGKGWHLGPGAREPAGEGAERLRHVGISWEVLKVSPYFPGRTTSIVFRREKRPRGHYAPPRANLRSFVADKLHEGLLIGLDAGWRAGLNVELARTRLDEATKVGDLAQVDRATTTLLDCTHTEMQAALATLKMMGLAVDLIDAVKAEAKEAGRS